MTQSNKLKGWIYIITNKSMPGIVKIGYSTKDPKLRAEELNHTGSPHSYKVEYEAHLEEPFQIEQKIHKELAKHHEGKEWFRCSVKDVIIAIKNVSSSIIYENFYTDQEWNKEFYRTVFHECSKCGTINKVFSNIINTSEVHCTSCKHVLKL